MELSVYGQIKKSLGEQINFELKKSVKQRNPSRYFYYLQLQKQHELRAAVSWEDFRGSWAYSMFNRVHGQEIQDMIKRDNQRFPNRWIKATD